MKTTTVLLSALMLLTATSSVADPPPGFSWVNLEADKTTMAVVRQALQDPSITAIREVGVKDGFALVMTTSREPGDPIPDGDRWSIYNISLTTGKSRLLVSGYGVTLLDWIGIAKDELAITYYHCWECEPETLFTTLHLKQAVGWMARWANKTEDSNDLQPGAVVWLTDIGEPYQDREVEQASAVLSQPGGGFAVGRWIHSHDLKSGKNDDDVERYFVDPITKKDRVEKLSGTAALSLERQICTEPTISLHLPIDPDAKPCRSVTRPATPHQGVLK